MVGRNSIPYFISVGYDSFAEVCFWPLAVISRFQVYRIYTSIIFHGSLLHVLFNMMALVPLGSELERVMGSIRLLYMIILLASSNAIFHLLIALLNISTISNVTFNDTVRYAWILLVVFQLLMTNVSLLGHLCGILSGFAYTYGLFNFLLPGSSFYSSIESSSWLSACVRRPNFILCTGGNPSGHIPTHLNQYTTSRTEACYLEIYGGGFLHGCHKGRHLLSQQKTVTCFLGEEEHLVLVEVKQFPL
ncbi:hypothetical protein ACSBR2_023225 [Camellia fascicularis]